MCSRMPSVLFVVSKHTSVKKNVKKQSEHRLMRGVFQELKGQSAALRGFFFFIVVVVKFPSVTLNWHLF